MDSYHLSITFWRYAVIILAMLSRSQSCNLCNHSSLANLIGAGTASLYQHRQGFWINQCWGDTCFKRINSIIRELSLVQQPCGVLGP